MRTGALMKFLFARQHRKLGDPQLSFVSDLMALTFAIYSAIFFGILFYIFLGRLFGLR